MDYDVIAIWRDKNIFVPKRIMESRRSQCGLKLIATALIMFEAGAHGP
jgi:hypothetical protein